MERDRAVKLRMQFSQAKSVEVDRRSAGHVRWLAILFALAMSMTLLLARPVGGQGKPSFGIRPAQQGIGHFTYSLEPGESTTDEIVATNSGDANVTLRIYTLDAHSSSNGGLIFPGGEGSTNPGAGAWLSLSISQVTLEPGAEITVPFTFTVPLDATAGEHVAGIVAENAEPITSGPNLTIPVVQRAAVPIWETVPGPITTGVEIDSVRYATTGGEPAFDVEMTNTGNISLDSVVGTLQIADQAHAPVCSLPVEVNGKFLAHDTIVYPVNVDQALSPGRYRVVATVQYANDGFASWGCFFRFPGGYPENFYLHVPLYISDLPS